MFLNISNYLYNFTEIGGVNFSGINYINKKIKLSEIKYLYTSILDT